MVIRVFGLVLLLSSSLPAEAQSWGAFQKKHIDKNMTECNCTRKIKDEKINTGVKCKRTNSFILATAEQVRAVCQKAGHNVGGKFYESNLPFPVVTCELKKSKPKCIYRGQKRLQYITVTCEKGFPVHYYKQRPPYV